MIVISIMFYRVSHVAKPVSGFLDLGYSPIGSQNLTETDIFLDFCVYLV